ncbi:MAG: 6-pyruvoyl trahydropterin synthase family protein [Bryobacteraceae bacterium]
MFVTRRAEFSASHVCRLDSLSEVENREIFGQAANPHGHGHNYVVEVTLEGDPDPITGMVIDLKDLKQLLEDEILAPMDHRFLNHEVKPFDAVIPTTENIAREIWRRLERRISKRNASLARVRLFETPDLYVDIAREDGTA